jgi:NitT/TauT family transport system substrate-binding protein
LAKTVALLASVAALAFAPTETARAEVPEVSLGQQFGAMYVPLMAMERLQLVKWTKLTGPAALTDAMLSGSLHFAAQGIPSLALVWDRTRSSVGVKGVGNISDANLWLNTRNPNIKSIKDFTEKDRIAVPSLKMSGAAIYLQMLAEKEWGIGQHARLDHLMVAMGHTDAVASLMNPVHEVNTHFATVPFAGIEIKAGMRTITTAFDIMGGQAGTVAFTTTDKFRRENPKVYEAVAAAFEEGMEWANADKRRAARLYIEMANERKLTEDEVVELVSAKDFHWTRTPNKVQPTVDFMHRIGLVLIKPMPTSWKDLYMSEVHGLPGS